MEYHKPLCMMDTVVESEWRKKVMLAAANGSLCQWRSNVSAGQRLVFRDQTAWFLHIPRPGTISPGYADERVAIEVETIHLLRERTSIPVPEVHAWGLTKENELGLGPFMLTSPVDGVSLYTVFGMNPNVSRPLPEDIPDTNMEYLYRQMAKFMLELFEIDFDEIGSLPTPRTKFPAPNRPVTTKANSIQRLGGVDILGDRENGFSTSHEYLQYSHSQELEQLRCQPNSFADRGSAESRYAALKVLESLIPELTMQLLGTAPSWLILGHPAEPLSSFPAGEDPKASERYFKYLDLFMRVLAEEEARSSGIHRGELSKLIRWSRDTGAMWFHMLLQAGFLDPSQVPFMQLRKHKGAEWWDDQVAAYQKTEEVKEFVASKLEGLAAYDRTFAEAQVNKTLLDSGQITPREFIRRMTPLIAAGLQRPAEG
ncbi:hypothetical protein BO78DRAFT_412280 [Aspergillus sclerotiicarbonarius CBS 121057]|uniref:Aminoglycoside phosphotransferase domain-containing protein n=1 Tax=Aspergillus sclerotiicarbonarius (strain CBS 121057 / IBT 28362) TaxID=1448318 RepID=A0A319DSJ8_ASPSB|nr:hypothetical protein BO78DRAFT_412280 [Aspergillus sclerotiicarbonarius CBS 121057]